jgi:hypothetical protein
MEELFHRAWMSLLPAKENWDKTPEWKKCNLKFGLPFVLWTLTLCINSK